MSKRTFGFAAYTLAGLLALAPAVAQTGSGTGSGTGSTGSGTTGTGQGTTGSGTTGSGTGTGSGTTGTRSGQGTTGSGTGTTGTRSGQGTGRGQDPNEVNVQDDKFFHQAASGGMLEVELGRLAAEKASNAQVKAFGQRMVTDHGKANQQLMQIATSMRKQVPTQLLPEHRAHRDQLSRLSGAEFDRMYMQHMVMEHKKDVTGFEQQAQRGTVPELRSFAQQTLPVLREHMTMAQQLATQVGAKTDDHAGHGHN